MKGQKEMFNKLKVEDKALEMNEVCVEVVLDHLLNTFIDMNDGNDKVCLNAIIESIQHFRQAEHWQMAFEQDLEDHLNEFKEALYVPNNG